MDDKEEKMCMLTGFSNKEDSLMAIGLCLFHRTVTEGSCYGRGSKSRELDAHNRG